MSKYTLRGLYAITDASLTPGPSLLDAVAAVLDAGAAAIQYRDKGIDRTRRERQACALLALCRAHAVPLIINDDVELAASVAADGVHLGRDDSSPREARARLAEGAIIGVSCYDDLERARRAARDGADYVAFGRFFPSRTKPQAAPADLNLLREAKAELQPPVVAIGGITPDNGAALIAAGADMLAVIEGIFGQPDPGAAARRFAALFT